MLFLSAIISLMSPTYHSTIPLDSVNIQFTYEKMESGQNSKKTYYYHLAIQNNSSQTVYVVIPKWFGTKPATQGIMREVDDDSHDGMTEFSFYANDSFEIYEIAPGKSIDETQCKIRTKSEGTDKSFSVKIPVYITHHIKIGELQLDDYVQNKNFYGANLTYEMVDVGTMEMSVALK